ncbi:hypothetical protein [Pseudomonas sp. BW7P1]|uniref:hypothetical protein n=1 Tax=Pseudomonas TaxID=286 RepID=UPI0021AE22EF|nr:hypothetical protein [Pseudomonas sp. BW7P1]UWI59803.1 hypothetical protein NWV16_17005 [Pseudomonas sp. BW7P1]
MSGIFWKTLGILGDKSVAHGISPSPFLARFNFYEMHQSGTIAAQPDAIIAAVCALDMRADRVADALLTLRELPAKLIRIIGNRPTPAPAPFGFDAFTLLRRTDHEVSLGLAGRFWRPDLDPCHVADAAAFMALDDPRVARLVLRFQVIEQPDGLRTLRTETFVSCPNTRTRWLFTPYWLVIRLASGWIRRRTLTTIQRQFQVQAR